MILVLAGLAGLASVLGLALFLGGAKPAPWAAPSPWAAAPGAIPIGILGDSDSASYQGQAGKTADEGRWGSARNASLLQWPEVLARLRGDAIDLGEWAEWGVPRWLSIARLRDGLGLRWRGPRKIDYRNNLAWASGCSQLLGGPWRQAPRLIDVMDEAPAQWAQGVVIIRIGVNDFGKEALVELAKDPGAAGPVATMKQCLEDIRQTVLLIRERHPQTRIVLVGIFNNAHWSPFHGEFQSPQALRNIDSGLDLFDNGLRQMAKADTGMAFFDDRAWFSRHWGGRDADGRPAYRRVNMAGLQVRNSSGDALDHATLANGHAGLVWNTLWAQDLVELIRQQFSLPIDSISPAEAERFVAERRQR